MTKIKRTYATLSDVPETFTPFFIEKDGKAQLDVEIEGFAPASKIEEMRQTNVTQRQQHEAELEKFKDVDPEEYRTLKGRAELLDEHKLIKKGDVDSVVNARVKEATKQFEQKEQTYKAKEAKLKDKLSAVTIESNVVQAAVPFGLRKGAATDLIARACRMFKVNDDGDVVAYEADGVTPKLHLGDPYTIEEFVKDAATDETSKHLFEENAGGGGDAFKGGGGADGYNGANPWDPATTNRSKQSELILKNRPLAIKLAAKHNVTIQPLPTTR